MNKKVFHTLEYDKIIQKLIKHAASPLGKQYCRDLTPYTDEEMILHEQRETSDALTHILTQGAVSFQGVREIRESLKRLEIGSILSTTELLNISNLLNAAGSVKAYFRKSVNETDETGDSLNDYYQKIEPLFPLMNEIRRCILAEDEIADDASAGLSKIRHSLKRTGDKIHEQLNAILNSSARSMLQDSLITMRNGRYCLPVKAEYRSSFPGMLHDQSATGSTLFMEPTSVVKLNNEIRELELTDQEEIVKVLADLSNQLTPYTTELAIDLQILTRLDFIFAKAALSRHFKCSEPKFNTEGRIHIKDGRHPLLDPQKVVPITVWLGTDFDLLMVTGPNTGGKTVSLKTVGLFTLMGQAGLHIPAFEGSELAVFEEVFADIGDEQSIEQSLSTFSAHMTNIVNILNQAHSRSLCIFDELCSGTDPTEGAALAIAILNFLHNMKCRTMATTHYSELKIYALSTPGVENACCEFDVATLRPTYRLLIGIPGKSNAFAISKKLGLPDYIIEDAKNHLESEDETFEDVISRLEENRVTIEKERAEIESYKAEIARLKSGLEKKEERFDERRDKMIRKANEEAQQILREAKETADRTIKNINKLAASSGIDTKALEAERTKLRDSLKKVEGGLSLKQETRKPHKAINPKTLKLGDGVRVLSMNLNGTVSSLPDAQGNVFVQMGILRSKVNISDLELLQENSVSGPGLEARRKGSGSSNIKMSKSFGISPEINVLGMTVDEAVAQLDKYLDDAYIAHLPQVRIVHGKGTGALRAGIHKHLKRLKYVKEFHLGGFGEGDAGVTIVVFK